uniref:NADH dehydrogenase subunit 4L n=1 Tax=Philodina citrina TaxID=468664 RepID=K0JA71_9BILA|nr:NADH dehydrogenase subunit 4L [Philodina citrina]
MFLSLFMVGLMIMFFYLWGDYMKILIFLEIVSLIFIMVLMWGMKYDFFSLNFFFSCLIFLVCESSMGFLLFIFYISMENEVVKKMMLVQF